MNDLPIEIIYLIIDHLDLGDYSSCYRRSLDIFHLSCVNHYYSEILWQDPLFYYRLWKKYLSPSIPDISPIELRPKYYQSMRRSESQKNDYMRLLLAIRENWTHVFNALFRPCDYSIEQVGCAEATYDGDNNPEDYYEDFDATDERRLNVLFLASIKHGRIDIMNTLIDSGSEMDSTHYNSITVAIRYNQFDIFKRLIERGARIIRNTYRPTMAIASIYGRLEMISYLIELGEDVTLNGNTALYHALSNQHIETAKRLIEAGVDINSYQGFLIAVHNGLTKTVKFLLKPEEKDSYLYQRGFMVAVKRGHVNIVDLFLNIGVSHQDDNGHCEALFEATQKGYINIVDRLLKHNLGTSVIVASCHCALKRGYLEVAERLLHEHLDQKAIDALYRSAEKMKNQRAMNLLALKGARMANPSFHLRW